MKGFIPPFIVTFAIAMFVLLMQILWLYMDDLAGKGLGFFLVVELLAYKCVSLVPLALPLAILISSLMLMGGLAEHYELSSLKSAGIRLLRIMRPLLFYAVCAAVLSYLCSDYFIPQANLQFGSRMWDIQRQKPTLRLDEGVFNEDFDGFSIHIGKKATNNKDIEDIIIYNHSRSQTDQFNQTIAESGRMFPAANDQYFVMRLENGNQYMETDPENPNSYPFVRVSFKEWEKIFDLKEFQLQRTDEELFKSNRNMMTSRQLRQEADTIQLNIERRKLTLSNYLVSYFHGMEKDSLEQDRQKAREKKEDEEKQEPQLLRTANTQPEAIPQEEPVRVPVRKTAIVKDTVTMMQEMAKAPDHKKKIWMSKAQTTARSIHNQSETARTSVLHMGENRIKVIYDMHMKYSMALVCVIFLFIGAPMGAIIRKGGFGYPILVAIIFFMLFIILTIFCRKIAEAFILPPSAAGWLPSIILLPVGIFLTRKAMNDSKLVGDSRLAQWIRLAWGYLFRKRAKA